MSPREKRTGMDKVAEYHELLEAGQSALKSARWDEARTCFERALRLHDTAEAHDGLGIVLWWLNELVAAHDHRTAACMGFKQQGDLRRAGFIAAWLAREQVFLHGNSSAMNGWFAHAERLLRNGEDCPEYGWFVLLRASMSAPPVQLQETALAVGKIAATWQDSTLGAVALAFLGMARVSLGNVDEGMSSLDEAMAVALSGEVDNLMAISEIFCVMLSACELASDLVRCEQWCQAAADFARRYDCSFLSAYCRTTYGSLMTATGRWQEADSALQDAMGLFAAGHRGLRVHALLKLADLR
ncbi:MAG: hypothetical protein H3C34_27675, partial [Caldilineaceae bacterium]|nr:hypothetical protein [Caldilineaceae bacterium]